MGWLYRYKYSVVTIQLDSKTLFDSFGFVDHSSAEQDSPASMFICAAPFASHRGAKQRPILRKTRQPGDGFPLPGK